MKDASSAVPSSGVRIANIEDFNADASSLASGSKLKATNNPKRKGSEETIEGERFIPKKARMVWTNELHNRFLMAIRQLGPDRASPKKIYETMNVPGMTRKHVASHLQKYRLFLKKVDELLSLEGASDENILSSKLANGLSYGMTKEIQKKIELIKQLSGSRTTTLNLSNTSPIVLPALSNASIPQVLCTQLPNPSYQGVSFQNQLKDPQGNSLRLAGQSLFGSNPANNFQQPILGGFPSVPYYSHNGVSNFSAYSGSIGSYDSINAANSVLMDGNYGMNPSTSVNKYGSLANISQGHGSLSYDNSSNVDHLRSFGTSNLHLSSSYYPTSSSNYSGIQGGFAGVDSSGVFSPAFSTNTTQQENFPGLPPLPPDLRDPRNAAAQSQSASNTSGDSQLDQFDKELTELFFLMDSISLIDEPQQSSNVIVPPTESIVNLPNELLTPPNENPNQLQLKVGHESMDSDPVGKYMVEDAVPPSNSANYNDQDFDMDLIEALFGTQPPN